MITMLKYTKHKVKTLFASRKSSRDSAAKLKVCK